MADRRISCEHFYEYVKLDQVIFIVLLLAAPAYGWETAPGYEPVLDPVITELTHSNSQQAVRDGLRLSFMLGAAYGPATQGQDIAGFNALVDQWNAWVRANFGKDLTMLMQRMSAPAEPAVYSDTWINSQPSVAATGHTYHGTRTPQSSSAVGNVGGSYLANLDTKVYHYPSCTWAQKILPENRRWFSSPNEARSEEYRPCEKCNPQ